MRETPSPPPSKGEVGRGMGEETDIPQAFHRLFTPSPPQPSP